MSKIKCEQEKCKYNSNKYCMKDGIYVDKHASCDSYEEGAKTSNTNFEISSLESKDNQIVCNATHCVYNNHKDCTITHLNIGKEKDSANCIDFEEMD